MRGIGVPHTNAVLLVPPSLTKPHGGSELSPTWLEQEERGKGLDCRSKRRKRADLYSSQELSLSLPAEPEKKKKKAPKSLINGGEGLRLSIPNRSGRPRGRRIAVGYHRNPIFTVG